MMHRSRTYSSLSPIRWSLLLVAALVVLAGLVSASGAGEAHELRGDVPTGTALRRQIADIEPQQALLQQALADADTDLVSALEERDLLGEELGRLAQEIEELRSSARGLAVSSFVSGGPNAGLLSLLDVEGAADLSRRKHLLDTITEPLDETSGRLRAKESHADADLLRLVGRIEDLRAQIETYGHTLSGMEIADAEARSWLMIADAWDRAEHAIAEGRYGVAPAEKWEALRDCESTDNYQAISPSGRYRGAYQFDLPTWETVGGAGDPALAPPLEQDARARELYAKRGHQPWPVCGRHLR